MGLLLIFLLKMFSGNFLILFGFRWLCNIHSFWNNLCHTHHRLTAHSRNLFHPFDILWFFLLHMLRNLFDLLDWLGIWVNWSLRKKNSGSFLIRFLRNWAKERALWLLRRLRLCFWNFLLDRLWLNLFVYRFWLWFESWILILIVTKKRGFFFLFFTFLFNW